jgi:hypothetical protein
MGLNPTHEVDRMVPTAIIESPTLIQDGTAVKTNAGVNTCLILVCSHLKPVDLKGRHVNDLRWFFLGKAIPTGGWVTAHREVSTRDPNHIVRHPSLKSADKLSIQVG